MYSVIYATKTIIEDHFGNEVALPGKIASVVLWDDKKEAIDFLGVSTKEDRDALERGEFILVEDWDGSNLVAIHEVDED